MPADEPPGAPSTSVTGTPRKPTIGTAAESLLELHVEGSAGLPHICPPVVVGRWLAVGEYLAMFQTSLVHVEVEPAHRRGATAPPFDNADNKEDCAA